MTPLFKLPIEKGQHKGKVLVGYEKINCVCANQNAKNNCQIQCLEKTINWNNVKKTFKLCDLTEEQAKELGFEIIEKWGYQSKNVLAVEVIKQLQYQGYASKITHSREEMRKFFDLLNNILLILIEP